ncbi:hypothetical protein GIB67_024169 [Kingdonia uniflora]|uniref:Uncharacterized protein n=1 Tax=Kingdonia uniflora TaxID=39325 RepID=A0A7J7LZK9_9MAGN|nr:hypothetical protein GIB67_024169 [Kingdonia uniflora]
MAREGDLVTYKRKRKTIDPSTVVPPNIVDSVNEGVSEGVNIPTESAEGMNIPQGLELETKSAQSGLGAQPPLPNVCPDFDDLNAFNSLKAGGAGISLSLKKLKPHYAYKLDKVLSDGTRYLVLFAKDKVAKKWSWGSVVLAHMYYNLGTASRDDVKQFACCTTLLESWIFVHFPKLGGIPKEMDSDTRALYLLEMGHDSGIHQKKPASVNEHGDTPVDQSEDIAEQYDASLKAIEQMKEEIEQKRVVDEQCALEFADLPRQLDAKILECKNLEEKNTNLEAELRSKFGLEDCNQSLSFELNKKCKEIETLKVVNTILMEQIDMQLPLATPLAVLQSHHPVPDTILAKKYEDLLAVHKDIKKRLIVKEDFEVWRQALKKALVSEGMGDMGDPTFKELFEQNERFFTIAQQGPKEDYQEDLVSMAVTIENAIIARKEKMAKKKKMQELLFQPWTKYLVDVHGVEISDNNWVYNSL